MIQFPIIESSADFELTPMYTSCEYSGPETSYMPIITTRFALCRDCGLVIRISSFDEEPVADAQNMLDGHCVSAAFDLSPDGKGPVLQILADSAGRCLLYENGAAAGELPCALHRGEEERGFSWTVETVLSNDLLTARYGSCSPAAVRGNAYKVRLTGKDRHLGAIAPMKDAFDIFSEANLAPMERILL